MKAIEDFATDFISAYNSENKDLIKQEANNFLTALKKDEYALRKTPHPYLIAKALFYLDEQTIFDISDFDYEKILRFEYFLLLRNYLETYKCLKNEPKFINLIAGCKLLTLFIVGNQDFLKYRIFSGYLGIMPNFLEKHLHGQYFLFAGIVKDAKIHHLNYFEDAKITSIFNPLYSQMEANLPNHEDLRELQSSYNANIEQFVMELEASLEIPEMNSDINDIDFLDELGFNEFDF